MADEKKKIEDSQLENVDVDSDRLAHHEPATAAEEAAVIRKLDWRLLPFVFVLYSLSILDRSNLGNARIAGLNNDLKLHGNQYSLLGTIFYVAYIIFQFTTAGWKQFKPHRWAALVVFAWGFIATIQATTTSWSGLMACRFFLGVAEACFGPGVPFYLSFFYPREKVGFRQGVFISGSAMANVYGSILAYGITQIKNSIAPWKLLFIIEGVPTCAIAVLAWFFLPDSLESARFLNEREKAVASRMVARNQVLDEGGQKQGVRMHEFWPAFKDPKSYLPAIMYFSVNVSYASLPLFVPTIVSELGTFDTVQSQGLSAPPYALVFFTILICSYLSDRFSMRGPFICGAALVGAIGFILLGTLDSAVGRYVGVFLAVQSFVCVALLLCWTSNMHVNESKRAAGYIILSTIGQCGPLVGTNIFPEDEKPYYRKGMWISMAFCLLIAVVSVTLSLWLIKENRDMKRAGLVWEGSTEGKIRDSADTKDSKVQVRMQIW